MNERKILRASCRRMSGHGPQNPANLLEAAAAWCRENSIEFDCYGGGDVIESFEAKVALLLGFDAARFMPSGIMAQNIALRVWSDRAKQDPKQDPKQHLKQQNFGMHPTSHLEVHEEYAYSHLHQLKSILVGPRDSVLLAEHLEAVREPLSVLLFELPAREIGGMIPTWAQLEALKKVAKEREIPLHLDGARLWECEPAYGRPLREITAGINSCYVSFYKGIGALSGAMLLGDKEFIAEAKVWQRRQGGTLYTQIANVATAAMLLDQRRARMPLWLDRAREIAAALQAVEGVEVLPGIPQTCLFHLIFNASAEDMSRVRDEIAKSHALWLFEGPRANTDPKTSRTEVYIGEAAMLLEVEEIKNIFSEMMALLTSDDDYMLAGEGTAFATS